MKVISFIVTRVGLPVLISRGEDVWRWHADRKAKEKAAKNKTLPRKNLETRPIRGKSLKFFFASGLSLSFVKKCASSGREISEWGCHHMQPHPPPQQPPPPEEGVAATSWEPPLQGSDPLVLLKEDGILLRFRLLHSGQLVSPGPT